MPFAWLPYPTIPHNGDLHDWAVPRARLRLRGFRFHSGAASCVEAAAAQWSESERAFKADKAALGAATTRWGGLKRARLVRGGGTE